ncbi:putative enoyl-CoA hydratase 1 [Bacteroides intestinalis CAG:315]|uniref:MaoC family dehydratase n=1 Tax=Bacteroides intestinalis TaxID=329854 RepID=A0A412XTM1_9BACE|nr:MaoC family dehydratase [Bacteroides intestinalis]RGV48652.1 MaoC family dehydratase [Bacteroides intestinalis]RHA61196.1 MaoC family dehydratase [Bacteroides intestinalis]CDD97639.1 putative enoyl-CoA hydratase 1 [Bacteroides intestinalis CAG:315]
MVKVIINTIEDFLQLSGEKLGESSWLLVDQNMINQFADATHDHQWIHVDADKAKTNSPYQTTIAHGYLTLSLLPCLLDEILEVRNLKYLVNYSIEKMVYKSVVLVDSKLRMVATLKSAKDLGNICKTNIQCTFEIEGQEKPVLEGSIVFLYYFN